TLVRAPPRLGHSRGDGGRRLPATPAEQIVDVWFSDDHPQVEAVEQGAREASGITRSCVDRAPALVVASAAWAGIGGPDEKEPRREGDRGPRPTHAHDMVFPAPGGPLKSRWWPPAAATSTAARPTSWPRTSHRSGPGGVTGALKRGSCGHKLSPFRHSRSDLSVAAPRTSGPPTRLASAP